MTVFEGKDMSMRIVGRAYSRDIVLIEALCCITAALSEIFLRCGVLSRKLEDWTKITICEGKSLPMRGVGRAYSRNNVLTEAFQYKTAAPGGILASAGKKNPPLTERHNCCIE